MGFSVYQLVLNIHSSLTLYIFLVVFPIIFTAFSLEKIFCMKKEATRFPLPLMNEGVLPSFFRHSSTTSSGSCGRGASHPIFPGFERMKLGVEVAPAQQAITSIPFGFHSYHRLS